VCMYVCMYVLYETVYPGDIAWFSFNLARYMK
jgi:hypothetical protein